MNRRRFLKMTGLTSLFTALPALALGQTDEEKSPYPRPKRSDGFHERYFPNVTLRTHENKEVKFYDDLLKNKCVAINFIYVKCKGSCSPITANLVKVQNELAGYMGKDLFFYSISLNPEEDTPEKLREYMSHYAIGPGWQFLTGSLDDIELIRRRLGVFDLNPKIDADRAKHSGMVIYGDEKNVRWASCPGLGDPKWTAKSIRWLLPEKPTSL